MAFVVTWAGKAFSNGPVRQQHFTYVSGHNDATAAITPPSFSDRVDYVIIDGVTRTAADTFSSLTATLTILHPANALYTFTVSSASATIGAVYAAVNGQSFVVDATIATATTLTASADSGASALAATGTLTKISGTGDATITYSVAVVPNFYGTGIAYGV